MTQIDNLKKLLKLLEELDQANQGPFGQIWSRKQLLVDDFNRQYPKHGKDKKRDELITKIALGIPPLLEGALVVYLFALWESHTETPQEVDALLNPDEIEKLRSFKHIRNSVAHKVDGDRASRKNQRTAFENSQPFCGIIWDRSSDKIDISNSMVAVRCRDFMVELTKKLIATR